MERNNSIVIIQAMALRWKINVIFIEDIAVSE
jgi:hypothetical protein